MCSLMQTDISTPGSDLPSLLLAADDTYGAAWRQNRRSYDDTAVVTTATLRPTRTCCILSIKAEGPPDHARCKQQALHNTNHRRSTPTHVVQDSTITVILFLTVSYPSQLLHNTSRRPIHGTIYDIARGALV
jgi:hypothetical protein